MNDDLPPGTEIGHDATEGIKHPLTISKVQGVGIIGNRRVEALTAGAGILAFFAALWLVVTFWYPFAIDRYSGWTTIAISVLSVFAVPGVCMTLVSRSGNTARDIPGLAAKAGAWISYHNGNLTDRRDPIRNPRTRAPKQRAWVAPREDQP